MVKLYPEKRGGTMKLNLSERVLQKEKEMRTISVEAIMQKDKPEVAQELGKYFLELVEHYQDNKGLTWEIRDKINRNKIIGKISTNDLKEEVANREKEFLAENGRRYNNEERADNTDDILLNKVSEIICGIRLMGENNYKYEVNDSICYIDYNEHDVKKGTVVDRWFDRTSAGVYYYVVKNEKNETSKSSEYGITQNANKFTYNRIIKRNEWKLCQNELAIYDKGVPSYYIRIPKEEVDYKEVFYISPELYNMQKESLVFDTDVDSCGNYVIKVITTDGLPPEEDIELQFTFWKKF